MSDRAFALLLHGESVLLESLKPALHEMGISTWNCRTCKEFTALLGQTQPHLVFTETELPDGMWIQVVRLTQEAYSPANVFVVGKETSSRLQDLVRHYGGYGYLAPPLEPALFQQIVRSAVDDAQDRRDTLARTEEEAV